MMRHTELADKGASGALKEHPSFRTMHRGAFAMMGPVYSQTG